MFLVIMADHIIMESANSRSIDVELVRFDGGMRFQLPMEYPYMETFHNVSETSPSDSLA